MLQIPDLDAEANPLGLRVRNPVGELGPESGGRAQGGLPDVDLARLEEGQIERLSRHGHAGVREIAVPEHLGLHEADRVAHGIGAAEQDDVEGLDLDFAQGRHGLVGPLVVGTLPH